MSDKIYYHTCHRCGNPNVARSDKNPQGFNRSVYGTGDKADRNVYCGICEIHLETGIIGYGLRPARDGFVVPRWAHHLARK
jgi:hypothetical protein